MCPDETPTDTAESVNADVSTEEAVSRRFNALADEAEDLGLAELDRRIDAVLGEGFTAYIRELLLPALAGTYLAGVYTGIRGAQTDGE